jgi:hypothetical protein
MTIIDASHEFFPSPRELRKTLRLTICLSTSFDNSATEGAFRQVVNRSRADKNAVQQRQRLLYGAKGQEDG